MAKDYSHILPSIRSNLYGVTDNSVITVTGITTDDKVIEVSAARTGGTHSITAITNLTDVASITDDDEVTAVGMDLSKYIVYVQWYDADL